MARTSPPGPVEALAAIARSFGPEAAAEKLRLLRGLDPAARLGVRRLELLRATLDFMRAYPDDAAVRGAVRDVVGRLPRPEPVRHAFSLGSARHLSRAAPASLEIDWRAAEQGPELHDTLSLVVGACEEQAIDDIYTSFDEWIRASRPAGCATDLGHWLALLERSGLPERVQSVLHDRCDLPMVWNPPERCSLELEGGEVHFQRGEIDRSPFPMEPAIRAPLPRAERGGAGVVDTAVKALCARRLEIYALLWASEEDVVVVDCGRGFRIALVGVRRDHRSALETLSFFLVARNGVPVAYGPAAAFAGRCEMGINLFPEFRGAEIRYIYAQVMRVLHHLLAVDCFFLTSYGMGEGNPAAIASGAFWFYRKLGFRATEPEVEALALAEEERMRREPGYRSDARMLRRLSHTEAAFDLSGGAWPSIDLARLGLLVSKLVEGSFDGDRAAAEAACARRVARAAGLPASSRSVRAVAPLLVLLGDLPAWTEREKRDLARALEAKDARSELAAARRLRDHARLMQGLRRLAARA